MCGGAIIVTVTILSLSSLFAGGLRLFISMRRSLWTRFWRMGYTFLTTGKLTSRKQYPMPNTRSVHQSRSHISVPQVTENIFQAMKNRTKKIFVGGVPTEMTKETLEEYFKQFGEASAKIFCIG